MLETERELIDEQTPNRRSDDRNLQAMAKAAAKEAIAELFEIFGNDITTPEGRRAVGQDLEFLRTARLGSQRMKKGMLLSAGSGIATGLGYLLWKGLLAVGIVVR